MCSHCRDILIDFRISHDAASCPLRKSLYCSSCASYGHLPLACPTPAPIRATLPCFVEQLIGPNLRREYNITSLTPLPAQKAVVAVDEANIIELLDSDAIIREYLKNHGITNPPRAKIRLTMAEYASQNGKKVRYIPVTKISGAGK